MGNTVSANSLAVAHRGSNGAPAAVFPDVCKTPSPGGPVPMPYPNIATSEGARTGIASKTVVVKGKGGASAVKSTLHKSTGDEAGTHGGIVSTKVTGPWSAVDPSVVKAMGRNMPMSSMSSMAGVGGPAAVRSPAARKGLAVGTGSSTQEPAAEVNAPPPVPCGNPACPHHTARVPATQTAQLPAEKVQEHGLLSPVVCLECYRAFAGLEPRPAATTQAATGG